ncbi:transcription elongation factor GreA [Frankia sp. CNm7]|uniref:Transcription elongation factor GreA n=1 Tax=Frankia nepalensis TaxID=1836974 RepID=A0A937RE74_9ACTN|nr:transcription elongation factor GreA [Frankia nepalensis]MBL7498592.1 transcription elongation factor GreA [Frankia nepalensis]MBL7510461.1 transcription elongation factor GreA [Frankia nepalensis]MBL7517199.1 transcription elongation factor GreA [Frankia nepalensis]MBL7630531.1 transcription elongation factor GreA [Frankia nepalensis]
MTQQTWLTQEAYDRLRSELDYLTTVGRTELANKIEAAREEGDLKENGGYHAAKEEQGKQEARIRQLTDLLRDAKVGEPAAGSAGVAGPGMVVEVRFPGEKATERFLIGSREDQSAAIDIFSPASPLGGAVTGHKAGEKVSYTLPNGRTASVEIISIAPYAA